MTRLIPAYTPKDKAISPAGMAGWARSCGKCGARFVVAAGLRKHPILGLMGPCCSGGRA